MRDFESRNAVFHLATQMRMRFFHFASGNYPCDRSSSAYPVNRLFLVTENTDPGRNFVSDGNGVINFEPGCFYLVPIMHMSTWQLTAGLRFISVHFTLNDLSTLDVFSTSERIFTMRDGDLQRGLRDAWNEADSYLAAAKLKSAVYLICEALFRRYPDARFNAVEKYRDIIDIIKYIDASGNAGTTVEELAARAGMRPDVFSKYFSSAAGMPPKVWLNRVLTRKAGELLMHNLSSRETASRLGFNNEFYFSRFFKKQTGISPREFRSNYPASPDAAYRG